MNPNCGDQHVSKSKIICKTKEDIAREKKACEKPVKSSGSGSRKGFETSGLIRKMGPKQIEAFSQFMPSIIAYSTATILATLYFTDWKAVLQYLPYYNGKYKEEEDEK